MAAKKKSQNKPTDKFEAQVTNSLTELMGILNVGAQFGAPVSKTDTLYYNNRWNLLSNNRNLLTEMYIEHGIVQTLVDQPVDDAFRAGFEIKTNQFDADEIEKLQIYCEEHRVIDAIMQTLKWTRLFGGGALLTVTDQDPSAPLDLNKINEKSKLNFIAVDEWELSFTLANLPTVMEPELANPFYDYYGIRLHESRVKPIRGKVAPSLRRPQLRGWGMSELERLVRSINQYLKNQDLIFELLDEAKIDVYKINGFTQALMTSGGTNLIAKRIQKANELKNYNNALTMDIADEYDQKQIAFTGLAEILQQIRIGIAADLKMPVTKLFGMSSAGFNSGEDDIENYNSMIEAEVRSKSKFIVMYALKLCCKKLFNEIPDDLMINWKPLRILSAEQEENVRKEQFARVLQTYQAGLCTDKEAKSALNKDSLLPIEIDENIEAEITWEQGHDETIEKGVIN